MSVGKYIDVIRSNDSFTLIQTNNKTGSALSTLNRIEEILRDDVPYSQASQDQYANLSKLEVWKTLKEKSRLIRVGHSQRIERLSCLFCRGTFFVDRRVGAAYHRIKHFPYPIDILPSEIEQIILDKLPIKDLCEMARVNRNKNITVEQAQISRARLYGYAERDLKGAQQHIKNTLRAVSTLIDDIYIPNYYIISANPGGTPDLHATIKSIL